MFDVGDDEGSEDDSAHYEKDSCLLLFGQFLTLALKQVARAGDHNQRNDPD